jgi:hypothetical protein
VVNSRARRDQRLSELDERLRLLADFEADLQCLGFERGGHRQHDVGKFGCRGHEQVGRGGNERLRQRIGVTLVRHPPGPVTAMKVVAAAAVPLRPAKVREQIAVGPARNAPPVVGKAVPADVYLRVHRRAAAEYLSPREVHPAPVQAVLRCCLHAPVVAALEQLRERGRNTDVDASVPRASLDQQNADAGAGGEACSERTPGRAGTHDDVVVFVHALSVVSTIGRHTVVDPLGYDHRTEEIDCRARRPWESGWRGPRRGGEAVAELRSGVDAELAKHAGQVAFDRSRGHIQPLGDLAVAHAGCGHARYPPLARGQRLRPGDRHPARAGAGREQFRASLLGQPPSAAAMS